MNQRYDIFRTASSGAKIWIETVADITEGKGRLLYLELTQPGREYLLFDSERHSFVEPDVADFRRWKLR
ncbi:MAG: hypothetical protein WB630_04855 [Candidatus Acidiferrales bacterium]